MPDDWKEFESDWREPILRQTLAVAEWAALSAADRQLARKAARGYVAWRGRQRKPPNVLSAHLFLRERSAWPGFAAQAPDVSTGQPDGVWIAEGSDADRVLSFLRNLARVPSPFVRSRPDGTRGYYRSDEVGADALAMLKFVNDLPTRWPLRPRGSPEFAAWQQRFVDWVGRGLTPRIGEDGVRVPGPFPPAQNGKVYRDEPAADSGAAEAASDDGLGNDDAEAPADDNDNNHDHEGDDAA